MTIEIADRLVKLRKKYGYSQEELADKLGLSRQAVSKWERAEASPDTDNLICLAKLYGVSLDELLATEEDIDTIVEEQVKDNKEDDTPAQEEKVEVNKDDHVIFVGKKGKKVTINDDGITCYNADGTVKKHQFDTKMAIIGAIEATLFTLAIVAYVVTSALLGWWGIMWIVFFIPEIICSIARAIVKRNANHFNMAFVAIFTFFLVSFTLPVALGSYGIFMPMYWHPMWVVFLAIPAYHSTVGAINKVLGKKDDDEKEDEDEDDD